LNTDDNVVTEIDTSPLIIRIATQLLPGRTTHPMSCSRWSC